MVPSLERDMKDAAWFVEKVRASESYAQNVYAALCNNAFQKLELMPVLKDEVWSCSWRYSGGLVADIRCEGDYMDWYCSGIRGGDEPDVYQQPFTNQYVSESTVTEEVSEDLKQLGWVVVEDYYNDGI